jgi:hypothetical protein
MKNDETRADPIKKARSMLKVRRRYRNKFKEAKCKQLRMERAFFMIPASEVTSGHHLNYWGIFLTCG